MKAISISWNVIFRHWKVILQRDGYGRKATLRWRWDMGDQPLQQNPETCHRFLQHVFGWNGETFLRSKKYGCCSFWVFLFFVKQVKVLCMLVSEISWDVDPPPTKTNEKWRLTLGHLTLPKNHMMIMVVTGIMKGASLAKRDVGRWLRSFKLQYIGWVSVTSFCDS